MPALILKLALSYLESHPDVVEQLIGELVSAIVNALKKHNATQAVPAK